MHFSTILVPVALAALQVSAAAPEFCAYFTGSNKSRRQVGVVRIGEIDTIIADGTELVVHAQDSRCQVILANGKPGPEWLSADPV
ncbi:uncharacterized protein PgNI_07400 [Pyricularia grisea]|uniref:Uncharacterized protein n=1 Tax=Pyricularia grisea TaxID=148305 RepID=A0A6P8B2K2_PYRGI|nr:uncharacterized protein PgNI_07400 [Pyricularia grisea]TLD09024.1 hypothetical protein PgNI_07400 [Pyricularia grisea]